MAKQSSDKPNRLADYRSKRSAQRTPEPFGGGPLPGARRFVVQQHAARNLHYDLRLEIAGALHSWAVPKGPSLDPQQKRLAREVEDHPLEYGDFEGIIPEGNYGAGAVIVWDRGRWDPIGADPVAGLEDGKLLFDLWGYKLRGRFTLFRTKGDPRGWLLVKKPDAYAGADGQARPESILSGLTVEELRAGADRAAGLRTRLARLGAVSGTPPRGAVEVMLARTAERPFRDAGWVFELKYDGYRLVAVRDSGVVRLQYRNGGDATAHFPEIVSVLRHVPADGLVLDGELVVLDEAGKPSFQRLQQRARLARRSDVDLASVQQPATFFAFDLLWAEGFDLRELALVERKRALESLLPSLGPVRYSDHVEREGEEVFRHVESLGLEGVVAKQADAPYRAGRSPAWLKLRADRTDDFVVVGFTAPAGSRSGFGALQLAARGNAGLVYAGRVGSGFSAEDLEEFRSLLDSARRETPPCDGVPPDSAQTTWVEPGLVVEVRYKEWTDEGLLRQPVFLRLRPDKTAESAASAPATAAAEPPAEAAAVSEVERVVQFTNLNKVFWPEHGYTKGDLIEYYRSIAEWLLPYLHDRPVVLTRYPDGIHGKNFFQKDAPGFAPAWIRTETMWSENAQREIRYFICNDEESLLYLANLGTIPLHLWSSRLASLQHPDWCILDLDPKQAPFRDVVRVARAAEALCREIGLDSFVKTSGSTGIHLLLPLGGLCTYEQSRTLGQLLARVLASELPEIATISRALDARDGKVYVDFLQNGHGRLLVAPFCVRPLPGAPVSTPLRWSEVNQRLRLERHTIRTVPARMRRLGEDPLRGVLAVTPDLTAALARLLERMERTHQKS